MFFFSLPIPPKTFPFSYKMHTLQTSPFCHFIRFNHLEKLLCSSSICFFNATWHYHFLKIFPQSTVQSTIYHTWQAKKRIKWSSLLYTNKWKCLNKDMASLSCFAGVSVLKFCCHTLISVLHQLNVIKIKI